MNKYKKRCEVSKAILKQQGLAKSWFGNSNALNSILAPSKEFVYSMLIFLIPVLPNKKGKYINSTVAGFKE